MSVTTDLLTCLLIRDTVIVHALGNGTRGRIHDEADIPLYIADEAVGGSVAVMMPEDSLCYTVGGALESASKRPWRPLRLNGLGLMIRSCPPCLDETTNTGVAMVLFKIFRSAQSNRCPFTSANGIREVRYKPSR